jgi:hypothetical protein
MLNCYGFNTPEQKKAFEDLFLHSFIIPPHKTWHEAFPLRETRNLLAKDITRMIKATQTRTGNQERWETPSQQWMDEHKHKIIPCLTTLGFVNAIEPTTMPKETVICVLGATLPTIQKRLDFLKNLIDRGLQPKTIVLLGGERYVTQNVDGTKEELTRIATALQVDNWKNLTETDLFKYAYAESDLSKKNFHPIFIHTRAKDLPRPTTQTTLIKFIAWTKKNNPIKGVLFISSQPHVKYQKAIIASIFKDQEIDIFFDVAGSSVAQLDNVKAIFEGFGAYIWAFSPTVLSLLNMQDCSQELKETLKEIYAKNPLLYNTLPQVLQQK